jgi:hypothetical protein
MVSTVLIIIILINIDKPGHLIVNIVLAAYSVFISLTIIIFTINIASITLGVIKKKKGKI